MKRFLMFAAAAGVLCFPAAVTAAKGFDVVRGPACGDINLDVAYTFESGNSGPATATSTFTTSSAPSCKKGTYTVYVYDASGANRLSSCAYAGDGVTIEFVPSCQYTSPTGDPLCVYATSQGDDGHIIDTAPNEGCDAFGIEPIVAGSSGATSFH
jgi:hypothetical protein